MVDDFKHETILLNELVDSLNVTERPNGVFVDCTLGGGGHSESLLQQLGDKGHLYAFDQDQMAIDHAEIRLRPFVEMGKITFIKANFRDIKEELLNYGVNKIDGVMYDLGVSSPQLDQGDRGFSYHKDAKLDMRMDQMASLTAFDVVNTYSYSDLVRIFYRYGEEKFSKQVARLIESSRQNEPIETTGQLVEIIKTAIPAPARRKGGHPAKRIFQAIRIEVNDELSAVEESLEQAIELLNMKGRVGVITFHSLEDRLTKQLFKSYAQPKDAPHGIPVMLDEDTPVLKLVSRKPITPTDKEVEKNNRARSAKLRCAEKIREK